MGGPRGTKTVSIGGESLDPMHVITMWLAVDESKVENGCMRVISGSHKLRDRRYESVDRKKHAFRERSLWKMTLTHPR